MSTSGLDGGFNLQDLVKKVLLAFCEVHVSFTHRLDIYGSIHVRSDDSDLTCFVLNEHTYKQTDSRKKDSDSGLTRYVSSVSGSSSAIETVFHQNSNLSGQVLPSTPNRSSSSQAAEASTAALLSSQPDNGHGNHRSLSTTPSRGGKATGRAAEKVETRSAMQHPRSGAGDPVSDNDEPSSDVHRVVSATPDVRPQDASTEAEPWPESTFDPVDDQNPSHYDQKMSYIKSEEQDEERDSQATIKLEPANENEIIELESDDEGYDQPNQSMFSYAQSDYDPSALYPGYPSSSAPNSSDTYSQVTWMQSSTSSFHSPNDPESFSAMNSINKPPPQKICSFCLKCFTTTVQLRMHIQRYHSTTPALEGGANANWRRRQGTPGTTASPGTPGADKRLTCSICLLSFRSLDGLRCHENSKHSRNKVYNCQYCSQVFLTRQAAYTHRTKFHRMKKNESPAA